LLVSTRALLVSTRALRSVQSQSCEYFCDYAIYYQKLQLQITKAFTAEAGDDAECQQHVSSSSKFKFLVSW